MILVDTCIWIEFLKGKEPVYSQMVQLLENGDILACELVFAELMQGAKNKREREIISEYWKNLPKFSINGVAFKAGTETGLNKWKDKGVGIIDATIFMYAKKANSSIWTIDKKLNSILPKDYRY